jgi:hypothetical protein
MAESKWSIPKLNGSNYHAWSAEMVLHLQSQGYYRFVEYENFEKWYEKFEVKDEIKTKYELRMASINKRLSVANKNSKEEQVALKDLEDLEDKHFKMRCRWGQEKKEKAETWKTDEESYRYYQTERE